MRFNSNLMIALGCVSLLAMSEPAFSQSKPQPGKPKAASKSAIQNAAQAKAKSRNIAARDGRVPRLASTAMAYAPKKPTFGWPVLVSEARKYMGTNPTDRKRLWCATFMNMVLAEAGYSGTNSDAAKSFAQYGRRISEPRVGAIAVLTRGKNGGHVGVVSGIDANGNPIVISGNHNKRVGEATYPRSRVIAYVMPTETRGNTQLASNAGNVSRPSQDDGIDSPIAELLAAIEAEPSPARSQQGAQAAVRQPAAPSGANARRPIELDPALAQMFGIKPRGQPAPRVAPQPAQRIAPRPQPQVQPPQRELRVEQVQSGRVASDAGLASRLLPVSR